jgi:hypothetical protein
MRLRSAICSLEDERAARDGRHQQQREDSRSLCANGAGRDPRPPTQRSLAISCFSQIYSLR